MELAILGINVTKYCNLDCVYCLCGEPKKESITSRVIDNAFKGINKIGELYFTGGDPLSQPKLIREVVDKCIKEGINISKISITTNATFFNEEVKSTLIYISRYASLHITVSVDEVHQTSVSKKFDVFDKMFVGSESLYKGLVNRIYEFCKENKFGFEKWSVDIIAKMGRASNMPGAFEVSKNLYALGNYYLSEHLYTDDIIIDTTGNVLRCDYENDEVEKLSIGNVLDDTLENIIFNKCVKELSERGLKYDDPEKIKREIDIAYLRRNRK